MRHGGKGGGGTEVRIRISARRRERGRDSEEGVEGGGRLRIEENGKGRRGRTRERTFYFRPISVARLIPMDIFDWSNSLLRIFSLSHITQYHTNL